MNNSILNEAPPTEACGICFLWSQGVQLLAKERMTGVVGVGSDATVSHRLEFLSREEAHRFLVAGYWLAKQPATGHSTCKVHREHLAILDAMHAEGHRVIAT